MNILIKEIVIAFAVSTCTALIVGSLMDATASSTAFGVVFPTVIAVLERREREKDQMREAELRRELESPQLREDRVPLQEHSAREASDGSTQEELGVLQQRAALHAIDWRRVIIGAVVSIILVNLTVVILSLVALIFAIFIFESALVLVVPIILAACIMLGTGFWVGRKSAGGGFLGAVVMGSIIGVSVPLVLLSIGGLDQEKANIAWAFFFFTSSGVLMASIGGWLGVQRCERVPATQVIQE